MTTEPIRPELLEYLREQHDQALLAAWPVQPSTELVPVRQQLHAQLASVPRREAALFTPDQVAESQAAAQRDVAIALKRASTGVLLALGGLGLWFAGMGVHEIGDGIKDAGIGLWAVAAIFVANAVSRAFAPKRSHAGGVHVEVRGSNNRIRL